MYRVSNFVDEIKKIESKKVKDPYEEALGIQFYIWFDTYEEAKNYLIGRTVSKINSYKLEIKKLERKLPKLKKMEEKAKPQTT